MNPLVVVRREVDAAGKTVGRGLWIWCPGCDQAHRPQVVAETGERPAPCWEWNGRTDEGFSIEPSLLVTSHYGGDGPDAFDRRCHSFIRNGQWQFLTDSTHELAGQTVPMVPVPDWLVLDRT